MKESSRARRAFEDYYNLGPGRSLAALARRYQKQTKARPPTRQMSQLKKWSTELGWQARVAARDAELAAKEQAALEAERIKVIQSGFALMHKRLKSLNEVGELLLAEVLTTDKRWLPDVKQIGSGEYAERVDLVRFNAPLIEQFRKTLDDIATELGQRREVVKVEDWRDEVVALLRAGKLPPEVVRADLGDELARELFIAAGVPIAPGREAEVESPAAQPDSD